jgi:hypothetical protein
MRFTSRAYLLHGGQDGRKQEKAKVLVCNHQPDDHQRAEHIQGISYTRIDAMSNQSPRLWRHRKRLTQLIASRQKKACGNHRENQTSPPGTVPVRTEGSYESDQDHRPS